MCFKMNVLLGSGCRISRTSTTPNVTHYSEQICRYLAEISVLRPPMNDHSWPQPGETRTGISPIFHFPLWYPVEQKRRFFLRMHNTPRYRHSCADTSLYTFYVLLYVPNTTRFKHHPENIVAKAKKTDPRESPRALIYTRVAMSVNFLKPSIMRAFSLALRASQSIRPTHTRGPLACLWTFARCAVCRTLIGCSWRHKSIDLASGCCDWLFELDRIWLVVICPYFTAYLAVWHWRFWGAIDFDLILIGFFVTSSWKP